MKKVCFVVMGFGKKMDYRNAKEVDLDIIYNKVIKEVFESDFKEYELIRADEISGSEIIDVSMYTLLLKADLVVADIPFGFIHFKITTSQNFGSGRFFIFTLLSFESLLYSAMFRNSNALHRPW